MSQQLNLFNPIFLRQKKYFAVRTMVRALAVIAVALAGLHVFQRLQLADLERQLEAAVRQHGEVQQQLAKFAADAKRAPSKLLEDEETRLDTQLKAQHALLNGLDSGTLGSTRGFSRYLGALARQTTPGVWLTGFSASGTEGPRAIHGRMLQPELLPGYLRMLNREEALRGHGFAQLTLAAREEKVTAGSSQSAPSGRYVEFTLAATKAGNK